MTKQQIFELDIKYLYDGILELFDIRELVSPGVYKKYVLRLGFSDYDLLARFDKRLLENLLWIRLNVGLSITVNTWLWGGRFDERGLRDTSTPMVQERADNKDAWISMHVLAAALDYDVTDQTAVEHRKWLLENAEEIPHPIRLENNLRGKPIIWVHMDVCEIPGLPKVYLFDI